MKKLKKIRTQIPRKFRLCILALGLTGLILTLYTFIGAPTLTIEQRFRRAEKAHLVGPSQILGYTELETDFYGGYWNMLIADDGDGITFFCYAYSESDKLSQTELIYRKKTGDITVLSAPFPQDNRDQTTFAKLPVFVFDDYPEAVRAELDITLNALYKETYFTKTYSMTSNRENPGYFQFALTSANLEGLGVEGYAIQVLTLISGYGGRSIPTSSIPATVRLYDGDDRLICERDLEITSVVEQAHRDQEN